MSRRRSRRDERGVAMVEMALVLPLVMALLLGIFTGGNAYFRKINLVDAAREGARYGASLKVPVGGIEAWREAVRNRVAELSGGEVSAFEVCADLVVPTNTNTACGVADPAGASTDPTVFLPANVVKVGVSKPTKLEFLFITMTPTLTAKIAARYERNIL
ncbi:MAG: TadE/TadG family type IV pilus assembly protein [Acidimicrobiales bacterium]